MESLPPEMQTIFEDIGVEYTDFVTNALVGFAGKTLSDLDANPDVTVSKMPDDEMIKRAQAVPNIAGDWVESTGPAAADVLTFFMEEVRAAGGTPLRDWDKELSN